MHLFVEGEPTICVAEIVNGLKGFTSHALREEFPFLKSRLLYSVEPKLLRRVGGFRQ